MRSLMGVAALVGAASCALETPADPGHTSSPASGPVLIVIAPVDFYYQEYADPRQALEEAGLEVKVASTHTDPAVPHLPSWEVAPTVSSVTADLTLDQVDPANYSALVIAGGWGATTYFYAFDGDPVNSNYDPSPAKVRMNALINGFLAGKKPILAVCNGVNVLSWARVTGTSDSPLKGKHVSAPHQSVPAMTYKGVEYGSDSGLLMPQFALDNGAVVAAKNSIGDVASNRDDVSIDGLILTAQDNFAAYAGGKALARALGKAAP